MAGSSYGSRSATAIVAPGAASGETESAYRHWVRRYLWFHGRDREAAGTEAGALRFLDHLVVQEQASTSSHLQALSALLFLFRHVLRNALIPIITSAGSYLPYVFLGSLVFESFFGIPGLGAFVIEAITGQDFAIVRTMVFLGALLYIASNALIDVAYTWVDPRVRLA